MNRPRNMTSADLFWAKVEKTDTCWLWTGPLRGGGYGQVTIDYVNQSTHRWAWKQLRGPIPDGYQLDHLCKVRNCVNPDHLEPVTPQENLRRSDAYSAVNARKTQCINGHPFTPENTYMHNNGRWRQCRTCRQNINDRRKAKRRTQ